MGDKAPFYIKILLYPLGLLYSIVVSARNKLFDFHLIRSREFHIPVISVGNITVGGTGKTPHIEYLIDLLSKEYKIAVLSRGYKRKTKGFIVANENTPVSYIGDEPWQLKEKYPQITVAVDSNRSRGIDKLIQAVPDLDIVLLDDAFQHRYVKPGISILLIDYNRPLHRDHIMPYGWLRESSVERFRANIVIISKSPEVVQAIDKRNIFHKLRLMPNQDAFFTSIVYKEPQTFLDEPIPITFEKIAKEHYSILLVAGIANPKPLITELEKYSKNIKTLLFPDHHYFTNDDLKNIQEELALLPGENKIVITTEKDVARLKEFASVILDSKKWYYIPIKISFHAGEADLFNKYIFHYVTNNNRNSILYQK